MVQEEKISLKTNHSGKFVTIDLQFGVAWIADTPEEAVDLAVRNNPSGGFHWGVIIGTPRSEN